MIELTQLALKEILAYDKDSGIFTWLERPSHWFPSEAARKAWNAKLAGKRAGYEWINRKQPSSKKYIHIRIQGKVYKAHRLAVLYELGVMPEHTVDHVDGDGVNNRWSNLRQATSLENSRNSRKFITNTSGIAGVNWHSGRQKWRAFISVNNKQVHLGSFKSFEEAKQARLAAERKYDFHANHGQTRPL